MTTLGWASTLLFGRVPASRQFLLLGVTFGSVIWMVLLIGLVVPDVGTFLLVLVPSQGIVPPGVIRLLMLIGVIVVPSIVGVLTLALSSDARRSPRGIVTAVGRGYPLTVLLAVLLVFLAVLALWRKASSLARRWTDAHIPIVVDPGAYDQVTTDLHKALSAAGLDLQESPAPATMSKPAKWLAAVAGRDSSSLVPDRMLQLRGPDLDILIYPMDVLIAGQPRLVARARAAIASRLTTSAAHLTVSAEAQAIEDGLAALARANGGDDRGARFDEATTAEFAAIDQRLASIDVPYEEWEVLYRQRLQVERDLRAGAMVGEAVLGAPAPGPAGPAVVVAAVGRILRQGTNAILDAVTDDSTIDALDRLAGPRWRVAAQAADVAAVVARSAVEGVTSDDDDVARADREAGEPATFPTQPVAHAEVPSEERVWDAPDRH